VNGTLFGLGFVGTAFQYQEFTQFFKDGDSKGWGTFGGNLFGGPDQVSQALGSQPPNTNVSVVSPLGHTYDVKTSVYGAFPYEM
jgi:hypothetical protein